MSREHHRAMPVIEIPHQSTTTVIHVMVTSNGSAVDLSTVSGDLFIFARTKGGTAVAHEYVAEFLTDGSDGIVKFTVTGDMVNTVRDLIFDLEAQDTSGHLITYSWIMRILPRAKVNP